MIKIIKEFCLKPVGGCFHRWEEQFPTSWVLINGRDGIWMEIGHYCCIKCLKETDSLYPPKWYKDAGEPVARRSCREDGTPWIVKRGSV